MKRKKTEWTSDILPFSTEESVSLLYIDLPLYIARATNTKDQRREGLGGEVVSIVANTKSTSA